jgi:hypothetical protein
MLILNETYETYYTQYEEAANELQHLRSSQRCCPRFAVETVIGVPRIAVPFLEDSNCQVPNLFLVLLLDHTLVYEN